MIINLNRSTVYTNNGDKYNESTEFIIEDIREHSAIQTSIIITIIILSLLSISGWIFMSYALFGRSEAYRSKPDNYPMGDTNQGDTMETNDYFQDFE
ncbi:unnamed protein product [Didymodactylos carnosus]|uniref:Uncharacterized protein n=2 Tax=Didymodactylos carnosus TaxID=1234261 RepID=A0A8S2RRA8_9BILA|nr:unnamed protein product [Didymodactylos carnosus]CAF4181629.1 unnamed protein product [Didymodactylos carnosus]